MFIRDFDRFSGYLKIARGILFASLCVGTCFGASLSAQEAHGPTSSKEPRVSELLREEEQRNLEIEEELKTSTQEVALVLRDAKRVDEKKVAEERLLLETTKSKILDSRKDILSKLSERNAEYNHVAGKVLEWQQTLNRNPKNLESAQQVYSESLRFWRSLVDQTFEIYSLDHSGASLTVIPEIPVYPDELLKRLDSPQIVQDFDKSFISTRESREKLIEARTQFQEASMKQHYRVLRSVGKIRSQSLEILLSLGASDALNLNQAYLNDVLREAHLVPYRALALLSAKTLEIREKASEGIDGILDLILQSLSLLLLLVIPFAFWWAMSRSTRALNTFRNALLRERRLRGWKVSLLVWIPRITPFVPWVLLLGFMSISEALLHGTVLEELITLIPYVHYYAFYRIFRIVFSNMLVFLSLEAQSLKQSETRHKIDSSARSLGIFFFWTLTLLHSVESVVNKALVYRIVLDVVVVLTLIFALLILRRWKHEIVEALRSNSSWISEKLARFASGPFGVLGRALGLLWLATVYLLGSLENWLNEFEFMKRVSARLFRRRLESTQTLKPSHLKKSVPEEYLKWFGFDVPEDPRILIVPENETYRVLQNRLDTWHEGRIEECVFAVTGQKGAGKSSLLTLLESHYREKVEVRRATVPPKLTTREQVLEFVQKLLGIESALLCGQSLEAIDSTLPKTIVLLDECQNLYLSKLDGFEGYKTFVEMVNARTQNIFWVCIFNQQAWDYLNSAFGRHAYFRSVYRLTQWSEDDIRKLILTRHKLSGYTISFDQIISAAQRSSEEVDYAEIETKFFRLLWEQASGNPRAALYYWLSSLSSVNEKCLKVGIPEDDDFAIAHLTDEQLFVLACLVRHENLSTQEMVLTTNLTESLVRHTLKMCLEGYLVERDASGRYKVTPEAQNSILRYLRTKNFIYG